MNITTQRHICHWESIEVDRHFRVVGKRDVDVKSVISMRNRNVLDNLSISPVVGQRIAETIEANRLLAPFTHINATMQAVATEINMYSPEAALIVSGFDEKGAAFILAVDPPGVVTDMTITGFHSIGTGSEKSVSKLLFLDFSRKDPLHAVMYDVFDAKAFAELAAGGI